MDAAEVRISKFLSLVLRHQPDTIGLKLDESGWIPIDQLIKACAAYGNPITLEQLKSVVEKNDKKRFAVSADGKMIRASQGHSIPVMLGYSAQTPPAILYHGTAWRFLVSIKKSGLLKMGRHHVHLSMSHDTASVVGRRYGKLALLTIDAGRMHADGYAFFVSANNIWLTDCVPVDYISFPVEV